MRSFSTVLISIILASFAMVNAGNSCVGQPMWTDVNGFGTFQARVVKVFPESSEVKLVNTDGRTAVISMHKLGPKSLEQLRKLAPLQSRRWTNGKGRVIEGTLLAIDGDRVDLWVGDRLFRVPLEELSAADRGHIKQVALQRVVDRVVMLKTYDAFGDQIGTGSAFFVDDRGWLATNYHVIRGAASIEVEISDKMHSIKHCVAVDRERDLAILPCPAAQDLCPPLRLSKRLPNIGDDVWVVGFPRGLPNSSPGNVGNLPKTKDFPANFRAFLQEKRDIPFAGETQWIQIQKAVVLPGSSGGPLVDESGRVLGVNTWLAAGAFGQVVSAKHLDDLVKVAKPKMALLPLRLHQTVREPTARRLHPDVANIIDRWRKKMPGKMAHEIVQAARGDLIAQAQNDPKHWSSRQSAFLVGQVSCIDPGGNPWIANAGNLLLKHHPQTHAIYELAAQTAMCNLPAAGQFCRQILGQNGVDAAIRNTANVALLNNLLWQLEAKQGEKPQQLAPLRDEIESTLGHWQNNLAGESLTLVKNDVGQIQLNSEGLTVAYETTHPCFQAGIEEAVRKNGAPNCSLGALAKGTSFYFDRLTIGAPAPDFCGESAAGAKRCLKGLAGKVVLLDFFADWCPPCRNMYPLERRLHDKSKKNPQWKGKFILVGVTNDPVETIQARVKAKEVTWNVCFDKPPKGQSPTLEMYRVKSYPTMFLLDKKGIIRYRWIGAQPGLERELSEAIDKLVAE